MRTPAALLRLLPAAALLLISGGCGDTTAPPPEIDEQLSILTAELSEPAVEEVVEEQASPEASPILIIPRSQWSEAETAADSLSRIGSAAVPSLVSVLNDPQAPLEMRRQSLEILARIGPAAAEVPGTIDALQRALQDPDEDIRKAAAWALGQIGPSASPAVPALMDMLRSADEHGEAADGSP